MMTLGRFIQRLANGYRAHHDSNEKLLDWIGVVGAVAFPVIYMLRLSSKYPSLYDDGPLRMVAALMCAAMAARRWWPERLKPYFLPYSYATVFYSLAFFLPFALLQNKAATPAIVNAVLSAVLIILLTDWRSTLVMLIVGYSSALAVYGLTVPDPHMPVEFLIWWIPLCAVLVAGGSISKYAERRAELARLRRLYAGLAGSIAHEMRNPFAQVQHALATIDDAIPPIPRPGQNAQLTGAQVAALRATVGEGRHAVTRGLQAVQVTLQQLRPQSLDSSRLVPLQASACVRQAVEEFVYEDDGQRAKVRIDVQGDFTFKGDATAFSLVLFNLLKNALFYTPLYPEATVTITVRNAPAHQVLVRDTGPGIAPHVLPRLFQEFQTFGKAEGTGLGLAFCRRVMTAFGGKIGCESELGAYTEFAMTFPAPSPQDVADVPDSGQAVEQPQRGFSGRKVLVVDDQALNRAIARTRLAEIGLTTVEASHGQQALDMLQGGLAVDAVLMDMNMPGLSGIQTTRRIRALPEPLGSMPVLALTGNTSEQVARAAAAAGVNGVLAKPIDVESLHAHLASLLGAAPRAARPQSSSRVQVDTAIDGLLNGPRVDSLRDVGILQELMPECLRDIRGLAEKAAAAIASGDQEAARNALHAILGLSGEAGAEGLYRTVRQLYERMMEGAQPQPEWSAQVSGLVTATEAAFASLYGVRPLRSECSTA